MGENICNLHILYRMTYKLYEGLNAKASKKFKNKSFFKLANIEDIFVKHDNVQSTILAFVIHIWVKLTNPCPSVCERLDQTINNTHNNKKLLCVLQDSKYWGKRKQKRERESESTKLGEGGKKRSGLASLRRPVYKWRLRGDKFSPIVLGDTHFRVTRSVMAQPGFQLNSIRLQSPNLQPRSENVSSLLSSPPAMSCEHPVFSIDRCPFIPGSALSHTMNTGLYRGPTFVSGLRLCLCSKSSETWCLLRAMLLLCWLHFSFSLGQFGIMSFQSSLESPGPCKSCKCSACQTSCAGFSSIKQAARLLFSLWSFAERARVTFCHLQPQDSEGFFPSLWLKASGK